MGAPCNLHTRESKGYAFVNFISGSSAHGFINAWANSDRFVQEGSNRKINVSYAVVQGKEENLKEWNHTNIRRIRDRALKPWVLHCVLVPLWDFGVQWVHEARESWSCSNAIRNAT